MARSPTAPWATQSTWRRCSLEKACRGIQSWQLTCCTFRLAFPQELQDYSRRTTTGLFYNSDTTNYHLLYQPNVERLEGNGKMLYEDQALRIGSAAREVGKKAIVFGPGKYIGQRELSIMGITFCQLPYEISKATQ